MSRQGLSWKAKLKYAIDQVVKESENFEDFLEKCTAHGILYEYNPDQKIDLKFMLAEQKEHNPRAKFTRSRTLGWFYETSRSKVVSLSIKVVWFMCRGQRSKLSLQRLRQTGLSVMLLTGAI